MASKTAGKYYPGHSILHKMDPRVKIFGNILMIVLVFLVDDFAMLGVLLSLPLLGYLVSGLPKRGLITIFKTTIYIGIFLFLINIFITKYSGSNNQNDIWHSPEFHWWKFWVSYSATTRTLLIMARIFIMIISTTLLTSTTKPMSLAKGIEDLLLPLKLIKVPVHIIAMIISIALRFIPTLLEETQRIMKAQSSRGVDFKNGSIKSKVKALITLIIPLFVSSFTKAEELGNAMETRGYDPYAKRTRYRVLKIKWFDIILLTTLLGLLTIVILSVMGIMPWPGWWV